jgi:hypothetical protein
MTINQFIALFYTIPKKQNKTRGKHSPRGRFLGLQLSPTAMEAALSGLMMRKRGRFLLAVQNGERASMVGFCQPSHFEDW